MPRRSRKPRKPRVIKVKVAVVKRPDVRILAKVLQGYISSSETDRLAALVNAVLWYDEALLWVMADRTHLPSLQPDEFRKAIDVADKCRKRALGTTFPAEKDTALRMALERYQIVCEKIPGLPLMAPIFEAYQKQEQDLAAQQAALETRFAEGLNLIKSSLGLPLQIGFCEQCKIWLAKGSLNGCGEHSVRFEESVIRDLKVEDDRQRPRKACPDVGLSVYNISSAKELVQSIRSEGCLPVIFRELNILTRHAAYETLDQGASWFLNRDKLNALREQALLNLAEWVKSDAAPNRLVRRKGLQIATPLEQQTQGTISSTAPTKTASPSAKRIAVQKGFTLKHGTVRETIYNLLTSAGATGVPLTEIEKVVGKPNLIQVRNLANRARACNAFDIVVNNGVAILTSLGGA